MDKRLNLDFEVSVIIPVFNAEEFIEKAITSALAQPEVREVLIVNDGSTDRSLEKIKFFEEKYSRVKVYHHPKRNNLGRSASRNLGLKKSSSNYIAFLDADDFFLEGRFVNDKKLFEKYPEVEGIYNAIAAHFYRKATRSELLKYSITTISHPIPPELLFLKMAVEGDVGWFHGNGLTVKKTIFEKVGYFNESLEVAEDSHMWLKMSLKANLRSGILDRPVSMRGVHERNIFQDSEKIIYIENYCKMYSSLLKWAYNNEEEDYVIQFFWNEFYKHYTLKILNQGRAIRIIKINTLFFKALMQYPGLLKFNSFLSEIPIFLNLKKLKKKLFL